MITLITSSYLADLGINTIILDEWAQFSKRYLNTELYLYFFWRYFFDYYFPFICLIQ